MRPHNPYEDPAVRRRHRGLVRRASGTWFKWSFLSVMSLGVLLVVVSVLSSLFLGDSTGLVGRIVQILIVFAVLGALFGAPMALVGMVVAGPRIRRSGRAFGPHYCKACGYSLRGLTEPKCPECGRTLVMRSGAG